MARFFVRRFWALALPVFVSCAPKLTPPEDGVLQQRADALVQAYVDTDQFSGTVLLAKGDEIVMARGYGLADRERQIENTPETVFRIGSVGKQFVAALVLRLVEDGTLSLDAPITAYLPSYPSEPGDRITLHMLLNHTAGLPNYTELPAYTDALDQPVEPSAFVDVFSSLPLAFEPGTSWQYSNSGYYVLGLIVEAVTGEPLGEQLQAELLRPLGLENTGYDDGTVARARGYDWVGLGYGPEQAVHPTRIFAAGMMYATAPDLFRWTRALHAGEPFRAPDTHQMMTALPEGETSAYVYGLGIVPVTFGREATLGVGHGGGLEGFQSSVAYFPEKEWTVVVLCNSGEEVAPLADGLRDLMAGREVPPPPRPLSRALAEELEANGPAGASAWLEQTVKAERKAFFVSTGALDALGSWYRSREELGKAAAVYEVYATFQPRSAHPLRQQAEICLAQGDEACALERFKRALRVEPDDAASAEAVERLRQP